MLPILWAAVAAVGLFFGVHWAFVAIMAAKQQRDSLSMYWRVILAPLAVVGLLLDAAFNLTFGTLMFRELPRELLFTSRCKRHFRGSNVRRRRLAAWWASQLNAFDPGHVS